MTKRDVAVIGNKIVVGPSPDLKTREAGALLSHYFEANPEKKMTGVYRVEWTKTPSAYEYEIFVHTTVMS